MAFSVWGSLYGVLCRGSLSRVSLSSGVSVLMGVSVQRENPSPLVNRMTDARRKTLPCTKLYLWAVNNIKTQKLLVHGRRLG